MRKLLIIVSVITIVIISHYFLAENYFAPYPYIDTTFSDGFSLENWKKIKQNMTKKDVYYLIGKPFGEHYETISQEIPDGLAIQTTENKCEIFSEDGALKFYDFAWVGFIICYDENDKVKKKDELINRN